MKIKLMIMVLVVALSSSFVKAFTFWDNEGARTISTANNIGGYTNSILSQGLVLDEISPTGIGTQVTLTDSGSIYETLQIYNNATVTMEGNSWVGGRGYINGNNIINMKDNSEFRNNLSVYDSSIINMSGTSHVLGNIDAIFAGTQSIIMNDNSWIGGELNIRNDATVDIFVKNFSINHGIGSRVLDFTEYGIYKITDYHSSGHDSGGNIWGIMEGGNPFSNGWVIKQNGSQWAGNPEIYIHIVPEPASLTLIALGGFAALRRKA